MKAASDEQRPSAGTLLDACAVLSLYASRHMAEIIAAVPGAVAICDVIKREALVIRQQGEAEITFEAVDLTSMIDAGLLSVIDSDDEGELQTFVNLSADLDDGEAMTAALAIHRSYVLVTDDRKAERLLVDSVHLRSTLDLVKAWTEIEQIGDDTIRDILRRIYERGYLPPNRHPLKPWWDRFFDNDP